MSIRLRLTLLFTAILALTLITFSSALYFSQSRLSYDSVKANLTRQAAQMASGPRRFGGAPGDGQGPSGVLPSNALPGRYAQTRSLDGTVLARTYDLSGETLPISTNGLEAVQNGQGWFETAQVQSEPLLIFSKAVVTGQGAAEIVQVAFPIGETQSALRTLSLALVAGCSAAILAALLMGWVLAGAALRPIHRITQTAEAIGAEHDFSRRVEHSGPNDEVGQLASTFNAMLSELETTYHHLKDTLDSQRRFVADASHELRTPLTTVRGNLELLRHEPPIAPEEQNEIVADTTDEVDRLVRLVNQLLVLARADAGQSMQLGTLPLKPVLDDVYRQARGLDRGRNVACGEVADVQVQGNRDALKQVLLILIDNAFKHAGSGASVALAAANVDGHATIQVSDNGAGISPDALPHIFERFYRGDIARSGSSAGLGLAIAKELVEAQGGTIAVQSRPGQGTTFTVTLRQAPAGAADAVAA